MEGGGVFLLSTARGFPLIGVQSLGAHLAGIRRPIRRQDIAFAGVALRFHFREAQVFSD